MTDFKQGGKNITFHAWEEGSLTFMDMLLPGSAWGLAQEYIFSWLLVIFLLGHTALERTYCFSVASECVDSPLLWITHGKYHFRAHKEVIQGSSWNRAEYSAAAIPFPNLHFNLEMMTGANSELVDVSQRGQTSPSVSIIAARQVSLSHPHGGLPSWIRGDAPLPLWPQKPQGETAGCDTVSMISTHWI